MTKLERESWKIAKKSGFVLWGNESYRTGVVDWSCDYDQEFVEAIRHTVRTCWEISGDDRLLEHFGLLQRKTL